MRLLDRSGHEANVVKLVKLPFVGDPLFRPKPGDNINPLLEARSAFIHAHAEDVELLRDESAPKAGVETAVANVIQHASSPASLMGLLKAGMTAPVISRICRVRAAMADKRTIGFGL